MVTYNGCVHRSFSFCPCVSWPGNPFVTWVWSSPAPGEPLEAHVTPHPTADRYIWMVDNQIIQDGPDTTLMAYDYPCVWDKEVYVIALDGCGATAPVYGGPYSPLCGSYRSASNVIIYPNPVSNMLGVKLDEQKSLTGKLESGVAGLSQILSIYIYDKMGILRKSYKFNSGTQQVSLNVTEFKGDIYYLDVSDGVYNRRVPVVIEK